MTVKTYTAPGTEKLEEVLAELVLLMAAWLDLMLLPACLVLLDFFVLVVRLAVERDVVPFVGIDAVVPLVGLKTTEVTVVLYLTVVVSFRVKIAVAVVVVVTGKIVVRSISVRVKTLVVTIVVTNVTTLPGLPVPEEEEVAEAEVEADEEVLPSS